MPTRTRRAAGLIAAALLALAGAAVAGAGPGAHVMAPTIVVEPH